MKVLPFRIQKNTQEGFKVQVDELPYLYNHLHQHPEIQITLIEESHGTLVAGDYVGHFHPGDVFVIGSNQPHVFRNDEKFFKKKSKAVTITLFFDESGLGEKFWELQELKSVKYFLKNCAGGYRITGTKRKLISDKLSGLIKAEGLDRMILFMEILRSLSNKKEMQALSRPIVQRPIKNYDGARLNKVIEFTFREFHRTITLKEVASHANLTPEAFCKYFKTRTRKTYVNFLNEIRIHHACRLINEDRSIASICYDCGFTNLSNFNRMFKKYKKVSPAAWRKLSSSR